MDPQFFALASSSLFAHSPLSVAVVAMVYLSEKWIYQPLLGDAQAQLVVVLSDSSGMGGSRGRDQGEQADEERTTRQWSTGQQRHQWKSDDEDHSG